MAKVNPIKSLKPSSLPLNKHVRFNITNTSMYVTHVTACSFYLCAKVFLQDWLEMDFFPHRGFYFSVSHTDSPIAGASNMSQVSTVDLGQDLVHFKYFYLLKNEGILQIPTPSVKDILTLAGIKIKISGKTKKSYQDQDSQQDQVVLQDQVIFQEQDNMEHHPWMQSYHGDFNILVAVQIMLIISTLRPSSRLRILNLYLRLTAQVTIN